MAGQRTWRGRERAGIFGHAQHAHAARARRGLRLLDEARPRDHHGRDAEDFGGDARARLLRRAEAAAAVAGDDRVHLEFLQLPLELVLLAPDDAGARIRPRRTDFVQQVDRGGRKLLQDEVPELAVRDGRHEAAADEGDRLAVERREARPLRNRLDRRLGDGRKHGERRLGGRGGQPAHPVPAGVHHGAGDRTGGGGGDSQHQFLHVYISFHL